MSQYTPEQIETEKKKQRFESSQSLQKIYMRAKIPDDWNNLDEFSNWYRSSGYPILPPADTKVYVGDITYSTVVFRKGRFQVELYMVAPNSTSGVHTHNHESRFLHLAGSMEGYADDPNDSIRIGKQGPSIMKDGVDPDFGMFSPSSKIGEMHGLRTHEHGCVFFNFEMWPEDIEPTSALVQFVGPSTGPKHDEIKKA
jgi:hypothetical protein